MSEGKVQILLEELHHLVETVAAGVYENSRRLDVLTTEVGRIREGQTRLELLVRKIEGETGSDVFAGNIPYLRGMR